MALEKYKEKRKFDKTPEPKPKVKKSGKNKTFVIQDHHARSRHDDLRLEKGGVLVSWAVPKAVPLKAGLKRLAVQTEDHPMDYANFEGEIPEGHYGAGKVKIREKGKVNILKWDKKIIEFEMLGKKYKGVYVLVNTKGKNFILFKKKK